MSLWRVCDTTAFVVSGPERVVVFNLEQPRTQPLALLGTGATIWNALAGDVDDLRPWRAESDLLAGLCEAYGVQPAAISGDVTAFLARMTSGGYVESQA
jgi:hypothetical protein